MERLKRSLMDTEFYPSKQFRTSSPVSVVPPPQQGQDAAQAQVPPNLSILYPTPKRSPQQFVPNIKLEPAFVDMDSQSNHCPPGTFNYPSPHSCSTVDSIPPMQIGQSTNHLYLPEASNVSMTSCSPTHFNGGSMTPINQNNNNNNMIMNNNINYMGMSDVNAMKMNAMSPSAVNNQHQQVFQQQAQPQYQTEQNSYVPQMSPNQYVPQMQPEQHQFTEPTIEQQHFEGNFSDLILNGTPMGDIDLIDETFSSLGLAGNLSDGFVGTPQMNNHFGNY